MTEIEKTEGEIKVLQAKLELLKEMEKHKSPVEEAYKDWWGEYPPTTPSVDNYEDTRWRAFQMGYNASKNNCEDISRVLIEGDDAYIMGVKYQRVAEPSKPMNEVLDKLENKYKDAEENAASYMTDEVVDRMLKKWEENPPDFLKFELSRSLEDRIYKWWETCFVHHPEWSMEECVEDLLDIITLFLPGEQDSSGSQNIDTVVAVEAHNELLRKIKFKLRNKKA